MDADAHTAPAAWVIRCTRVHGAYGPAEPAGRYLRSYDPPQASHLGGISTWVRTLTGAHRFPDRDTARDCYTSGLHRRYAVEYIPVPAAGPPVITGQYARAVTGRPLTEEQRQEAQDITDRLYMDGLL